MICKVCGSKNKDNVIFCEKCGNFISLSDKELFNNYISNLNIEEKRELALQIDILKGEKRHIGLLFIEIKGNNKLEISDFFSPLKKHKAYPIHIHKKSAVFAFLDIKYPETSIIEASISANQILDLIEHLQAKHRNSNIFIKLFIDYKRVTIGSFTEQDSFNLQKEDTKLIQSYLLDIPYNTIVSTDFARLVTQKEIAYTNIESKRLFKVNSITSRIPVRKLEKDGLFGRAKELSYLIEALEKVNKGEPKVIKLIGKPGVGKRNLIDFFARTFSDNNKQYFLKVKAASSFKDEPFYIISEILSGLFLTKGLLHNEIEDKIAIFLNNNEISDVFLPYLRLLVAADISNYEEELTSLISSRKSIIDIVSNFLKLVSNIKPIIITIENAEYIDNWSLETFKNLFVSFRPRIFLITTSKEDILLGGETAKAIRLYPFSKDTAITYIVYLFNNRIIDNALKDAIIKDIELTPYNIKLYIKYLKLKDYIDDDTEKINDNVILKKKIDRITMETVFNNIMLNVLNHDEKIIILSLFYLNIFVKELKEKFIQRFDNINLEKLKEFELIDKHLNLINETWIKLLSQQEDIKNKAELLVIKFLTEEELDFMFPYISLLQKLYLENKVKEKALLFTLLSIKRYLIMYALDAVLELFYIIENNYPEAFKDHSVRELYIEYLWKSESFEKGIEFLKEPQNEEEVVSKVRFLIMLQRYKEAKDIIENFLPEKEVTVGRLLYHKGFINYIEGDLEEAIKDHSNAIEILERFSGSFYLHETYISLGNLYMYTEDFDRAKEIFNKVIEKDLNIYGENHPFTAYAFRAYAAYLHNIGQYDKAVEYIKHAVNIIKMYEGESGEKYIDYLLELITVYIDNEQYKLAYTLFNTVDIDIYDSYLISKARRVLGTYLRKRGKIEEAIENYKKSIEAIQNIKQYNEEIGISYLYLADIEEYSGKIEEGIKSWNMGISILENKIPHFIKDRIIMTGIKLFYEKGEIDKGIELSEANKNIKYAIIGYLLKDDLKNAEDKLKNLTDEREKYLFSLLIEVRKSDEISLEWVTDFISTLNELPSDKRIPLYSDTILLWYPILISIEPWTTIDILKKLYFYWLIETNSYKLAILSSLLSVTYLKIDEHEEAVFYYLKMLNLRAKNNVKLIDGFYYFSNYYLLKDEKSFSIAQDIFNSFNIFWLKYIKDNQEEFISLIEEEKENILEEKINENKLEEGKKDIYKDVVSEIDKLTEEIANIGKEESYLSKPEKKEEIKKDTQTKEKELTKPEKHLHKTETIAKKETIGVTQKESLQETKEESGIKFIDEITDLESGIVHYDDESGLKQKEETTQNVAEPIIKEKDENLIIPIEEISTEEKGEKEDKKPIPKEDIIEEKTEEKIETETFEEKAPIGSTTEKQIKQEEETSSEDKETPTHIKLPISISNFLNTIENNTYLYSKENNILSTLDKTYLSLAKNINKTLNKLNIQEATDIIETENYYIYLKFTKGSFLLIREAKNVSPPAFVYTMLKQLTLED